MLAYVLDKEISGEKILSDIQKLVTMFRQDSPDKTYILYIDIKTITSNDTSLIPKLEQKNLSPDCLT